MDNHDSARGACAILVLGMHRSGTSALTGCLVHLGCVPPANQIPQLEQNPKGFFESRPVARLNDRFLESADRTWSDWRPLPPAWFSAPARTDQIAEAVALLDVEFGTSPLLVLKDPRICQLVPHWLRVLRESGRTPLVLHIHRPPLEVAHSLKVRNGFGLDHALLLWLSYVLQAEIGSRGVRRHFLSYDRLMNDPVATLARAGQALGQHFPRDPEAARANLSDFLSPELRHHHVLHGEGLPSLIVTVQGILNRWDTRGEQSRDYATLDRVRDLVFPVLRLAPSEEYSSAAFEALVHLEPTDSDSFPETGPVLANAALRLALKDLETRLEREAQRASKARAAHEARRGRERQMAAKRYLEYETRLAASLRMAEQNAAVLQETRREKALLDRTNVKLREDLKRLEEQNTALGAEIVRSEQARRAISESTTWRATAPVRWMIDRLRRAR